MGAERTEEEKLTQAPLEVVLGGEVYEIRPLVIARARPWREKYAQAVAGLSAQIAARSDNPEEFKAGLDALLVSLPDTVIDLFFEYAVDLDRKKLETVATEAEVARAFAQIMKVAFPLAQSLVGIGLKETPPANRATRRAGRP